jgi:HSP20 family protein
MRNPKRSSKDISIPHPADLLLDRNDILDPFSVGSWTPQVDTCQTGNRILVRVELPGVDPTDISLSYQGENLRIRGIKRKPVQSRKLLCYYCLERRYGQIDRIIPIGWIVNPRRAHAYFDKGILTIELPRLKDRRGDIVEIKIDAK